MKASNSRPHVTSSAGAPPKEGELCCYECGQKGHIKPQCPKLKGKQRVARAQIKDLLEEDEELSESLTNRAPNDALKESTYSQEGEEDLKNNSGDDEEEKPHYEWDEQEYKANFVHFINEEPIIDTTIRIAARTIDKMVEPVYNHHAKIRNRSRSSWKHNEYRAISVFLEIGGIKANCEGNTDDPRR